MQHPARHRLRSLSRKEIAAALGVNPGYISALRRQGLPAVGTVGEVLDWLDAHPRASFNKAYPARPRPVSGVVVVVVEPDDDENGGR